MNPPLAINDDTDHLQFQCPDCKGWMTVRGVNTLKLTSNEPPREDKCTYMILDCVCHNGDFSKGRQLKFYHKAINEHHPKRQAT